MLAGLVVLYLYDPVEASFYPRCPLFLLTGWQCAGCGTLRAAHCLLHGAVPQAMAYNPFFVCVAPLVLVALCFRRLVYACWFPWAVLAAATVYSVWRNF